MPPSVSVWHQPALFCPPDLVENRTEPAANRDLAAYALVIELLSFHVKVQEELERFLEDDDDMMKMCLSRRREVRSPRRRL